eukprot:TRINITY_DN9729_c0_g2_i1.p1 TRINITY_DN9729_c0_g2~~TRINITY_DN9729_c0_g2_i1.p1  ORF type:complete len:160 (-),score=34.38 TRINITY_DN9729_c0_g2_i1:291-770(-)
MDALSFLNEADPSELPRRKDKKRTRQLEQNEAPSKKSKASQHDSAALEDSENIVFSKEISTARLKNRLEAYNAAALVPKRSATLWSGSFEPSLFQQPQKSILQSWDAPNSSRSKLGLSSAKSSSKSASSSIKPNHLSSDAAVELSAQDLLSSIAARVSS